MNNTLITPPTTMSQSKVFGRNFVIFALVAVVLFLFLVGILFTIGFRSRSNDLGSTSNSLESQQYNELTTDESISQEIDTVNLQDLDPALPGDRQVEQSIDDIDKVLQGLDSTKDFSEFSDAEVGL